MLLFVLIFVFVAAVVVSMSHRDGVELLILLAFLAVLFVVMSSLWWGPAVWR